MEIKKSDFPKVLCAYVATKSGNVLRNRSVVFNQDEANAFLLRYAGSIIKTDTLNAKELKSLPITSRLQYKIPAWAYWLAGLIVAIGLVLLGTSL